MGKLKSLFSFKKKAGISIQFELKNGEKAQLLLCTYDEATGQLFLPNRFTPQEQLSNALKEFEKEGVNVVRLNKSAAVILAQNLLELVKRIDS